MIEVDYDFYIKTLDRTTNLRFRIIELCILTITACFISLNFYVYLSEKLGITFWLIILATICFIYACLQSVAGIIDVLQVERKYKKIVEGLHVFRLEGVDMSEKDFELISIRKYDLVAVGVFSVGMMVFFLGMLLIAL